MQFSIMHPLQYISSCITFDHAFNKEYNWWCFPFVNADADSDADVVDDAVSLVVSSGDNKSIVDS